MLSLALGSPLAPPDHAARHVLNWLHFSVGLPWAWAIVALTVIVRTLLVPLTVKQIHSMQNLQRHAPQIKAIQQKYKADRQRMNQELMAFYKENQINPAASCLPLVAQLPVFFALYFVLRHFSKHPPGGHAAVAHGDFSWLHVVPNIAAHANAHWSGYLLLAIYAASQISSTYFMGTTMQKSQRNMMMVLPLLFVPILVRFPTGLVLYWVTTNLWTVGQGLITRRLVAKTPPTTPAKRSSRAPRRDEPDDGDGAKRSPAAPTPAPAAAGPPRRVKKKKKARR